MAALRVRTVALAWALVMLWFAQADASDATRPASTARAAPPTPPDAAACRDRWLEPFASTSIWNTAIGSGAQFAPAKLFAYEAAHPDQFHNDQDFLVRASPGDPPVRWINQGVPRAPCQHCHPLRCPSALSLKALSIEAPACQFLK